MKLDPQTGRPMIEVPVELDAEPKFQALRRADIKLSTHPAICIAIPSGNKEVGQVFTCPEDHGGCGKQWHEASSFKHPNLVPFAFLVGHMNLQPPLNCPLAYLYEPGRLSAEARQIMTKKALQIGAKYILYWDDDTIPPSNALYKMHTWMEQHPDAGAISAVYSTRTEPTVPLIFERHGQGAGWEIPMYEGAEPVPIFGAGAGFLLARLEAVQDVIEKLKEANGGQEVAVWQDVLHMPDGDFDPTDTTKPRNYTTTWGHDIRFCKLLNEYDWPVYAYGDVQCGHYDIETDKMFVVPETAPGFKVPEVDSA